MRVFVVGSKRCDRHPAGPPVDRARARGDRDLPVAPRNAERLRALGAAAGARSTCSTPRPCARPCATAAARRDHPRGDRAGGRGFSRNLDRSFAPTNRLRTEGTDALLAAAREAGVRRFVAQSFAQLPLRPRGRPGQDRGRPARPAARPPAARETDRRDAPPRRGGHRARAGSRCATAASTAPPTMGWSGRCANGSSRSSATAAASSSFIHLDDAAAATVLALEHDAPASTTSWTTSPPR